MNKTNIAVLFGGKSVEHEVSIISGNQALHAIRSNDRYNVIPIYITKKGNWYTGEVLFDLSNYQNSKALLGDCDQLSVSFSDKSFFTYRKSFWGSKKVEYKVDVAFPVFHGTFGEDGSVQGVFELMDIPYTGSNVLASATTMDKVTTKMVLRESNVKVLDYDWLYADEWILERDGILNRIANKFSFPLIVKPSDLGSSIGISKAADLTELEEAIDFAAGYSSRIIVEPAITNLKEINCSVMGNHTDMETSVCEEPLGSDEILSFEDKYKSGGKQQGMSGLKRRIPANITPEQEQTIKTMAKQTFRAFDSSGLVRIDFMINQDDDEIYVNEINTIPGSLSFYLWKHSDINFSKLADKLIQIAVKRHSQQSKRTFTFDANLLSEFTGSKGGGGSKLGKA